MEQITASLFVHTPPTKPLEMKATMQILEELERQEREATEDMEEEVNDYHEHLEYQYLTIDEVVQEGEETKSSEEDNEDPGAKYIVENFDMELEEELSQQLKDVGEEVEKNPSDDENDADEKMEEHTEPPIGEHDKIPKHDEEMPLSKELQEKEKEEWEGSLKHDEEVLPQHDEKEEKEEDNLEEEAEIRKAQKQSTIRNTGRTKKKKRTLKGWKKGGRRCPLKVEK